MKDVSIPSSNSPSREKEPNITTTNEGNEKTNKKAGLSGNNMNNNVPAGE